MKREEEQSEGRKTISIEEYLSRRWRKRNQESNKQEAISKEKNSSVYMWTELYI